MLGLLGCAALAELFQPAVIRQSFVNLFTKAERSYGDSPMQYVGQVWLFLFRIGVVSMAISLFTYQGGTFALARYGIIAGVVCAVEMMKYLLCLLLNYTFRFPHRFDTLFAHYTYVNTTVCCVLYPLVLLIIRLNVPLFSTVSLCIAAGAFVMLLIVKLLRVFMKDVLSFVYILLYILTIEVLPFLIIIVLFS